MSSCGIAGVSYLPSLRPVLPASLEHDTVMDQKTPHDSAILHLLPHVTCHLTLECVNVRGIVPPIRAMNRFPLWGVSETGSDDRIRRLSNIGAKRCEDVEMLLVRWRCELGMPLQARQPGMHGRLLPEGV